MHAIRCRSRLAAFCAAVLVPTLVAAGPASATVFRPSLTVTGELWQNTRGGAHAGGFWDTLVDLGAELDLAELGVPAGGHVFAQAHWLQNRDRDVYFIARAGALNPVSGAMANDHVRVFNLHYHRAWRADTVALKIGQLALDDDFMAAQYASLFINSAFGAMPSSVGTPPYAERAEATAFPVYPVAAPGVRLAVRASETFSWQGGLYSGFPGHDDFHNHGSEWTRRGSANGAVVFGEFAWRLSAGSRPATLTFGGDYHSGRFADFAGFNAGTEAAGARGLYSFYVMHDAVLAPAGTDKPRIAGFWRAGVAPQQDRNVVTAYADAGLNWFAPLPGRPDDVAGAALSHTHVGRAFRAAAGAAANETTIELTYRARFSTHLTVQADAQFVFSPAYGSATGEHRTAVVLGLRTTLAF